MHNNNEICDIMQAMKTLFSRFVQMYTQPHNTFLICTLIFGFLSALFVPQLIANDEGAHFVRSYNLASGSLGTQNCQYPETIKKKYAEAVDKNIFTANYQETIDFNKLQGEHCGTARIYTPLIHLPQAIGMFIAKFIAPSAASLVLFGRIFNLLFYAIAIYWIIRKTKIGKWPIAVMASFPIMIHTTGTLSGDLMNNVIVIAAIAYILNLFTVQKLLSTKQIVILMSLFLLIALTKPTNVIVMLFGIFLPSSIFVRQRFRRLFPSFHKWAIIGIGFLLAALIVAGWYFFFSPGTVSATDNPVKHNPLFFVTILVNTYLNPFLGYGDIVMRGVVGEFASFRYHLPTFMVVISFLLLLLSLLKKDPHEERLLQKHANVAVCGGVVLLILNLLIITYTLYATWGTKPDRLGLNAQYADGVQGRYFIPLLVYLIPVGIWLRKYIWIAAKQPALLSVLLSVSITLSSLFYIIETIRFF